MRYALEVRTAVSHCLAVLAVAACTAGCGAIAGIDDLTFDDPAAGGAGSTGAGGSASTQEPHDWRGLMMATYGFESAGVGLGHDGSGHAFDLVANGPVAQSTADAPSEKASFLVSPAGSLQTPRSELDPQPGQSMTWGGFIRVSAYQGNANMLNRYRNVGEQGGEGFVARAVDKQWKCTTGSGADNRTSLTTERGIVPDNTWVHAVCRYDADEGKLEALVQGVLLKSINALQPIPSGRPFAVGGGFEGELDEVFFTAKRLSDASVRRIHTCGLSGARCACDAAEPTKYAECGRPVNECAAALPPCDQAEP